MEVDPRVVTFGQLGKGDKGSRDFTTKVNEPDKIKITSVTVEDKRFEIEKKGGDIAAGAQYELKFLGSDTIERLSSHIKIKLEGSESESLEIPIRANVVGNLRYSKNIYFLKRDGAFKSREIVLTTRSGRPIKIKKTEDPDKQLKLEIVDKEGQKVMVRAEVANPDVEYKKSSRHKMFIYTTDKDEPKVEIGYTISERRGSSAQGRRNRKLIKQMAIDKKIKPAKENTSKKVEE